MTFYFFSFGFKNISGSISPLITIFRTTQFEQNWLESTEAKGSSSCTVWQPKPRIPRQMLHGATGYSAGQDDSPIPDKSCG